MSWPLVQLGNVADISAGNSAPQGQDDFSEEGTPFVRAGSLSELLKGATSHLEHIAKGDAKRLKLRLFPKDSILFAKSGMSCIKGYVYRLPFEAHVVSHLAVVQPGPDLSPAYTEHALRVFSPVSLVKDEAYPSIRLPEISGLKIPLPPLEEQRRIAGILDQADTLRRLRSRALDKLNALGQAIFHEMFGDVSTNTKGLPKAKVGDHCERVSVGVVVKPASYYVDEGVPAIRGTNIKPQGLDLSDLVYFSPNASNGILKKSRISSGDVLAVRSGRPGLATVVPDELDGANCIDVLIATTRREKLLPEYLRDFLNSPDGRSLVLSNSRGQVQQHFNVKSLAEAEIPLPPISDQRLYLERITEIERQKHILLSHESNTADLFASLQHRAFRGEL